MKSKPLDYRTISFIVVILFLANPITLFLLFENFWIATIIPLFFIIMEIVLLKKTKTGFIYLFYLIFFLSLGYHTELIFNTCFPNLIIKNFYTIQNDIFFNKPNLRETIEDKEYETNYYTNCQGYRISSKMDPETKISQCDWLFIGDSYVQGAQVEFEDLFTTKLFKYFPDKTIVNAGISGFGIAEEFKLYKSLKSDLRPKKVFLVVCNFNDFMNVDGNKIDFSDYLMDKSNFVRYILFDLKYSNPQSLPIGRWTEPFYPDKQTNLDYNVFYKEKSQKKLDDLTAFFQYLSLFNSEVNADGGELVIIQIPSKEQVYFKYFEEVVDAFKIPVEDLDMNYPNDLLTEYSQMLKIKLIDLREPFAKSEFEVYFQYDEHLNIYGHEAIANAISDCFQDKSNKVELLSDGVTVCRYPTYYPAENFILYQSFIDRNFEILVSDTSFRSFNRLTFDDINETHPVYKDSILLFSEGNQGDGNLKIAQLNLKQNTRNGITPDGVFGGIPQFSNNSTTIISYAEWTSDTASKSRIVLLNTFSGQKKYLSIDNLDSWRSIFSKNDSLIYYIRRDDNAHNIYCVDVFSGKSTLVFDSDYDIWDIEISPDERQLVFAGNPDGNWDLFILNLKSHTVSRLTKTIGDEYDPFFLHNNEILYAGVYGFNCGIFKLRINK